MEMRMRRKKSACIRYDTNVRHKEFTWKIGGMSWLKSSLKHQELLCSRSWPFGLALESETCSIFTPQQKFELIYNPNRNKLTPCGAHDFYDHWVDNAQLPRV